MSNADSLRERVNALEDKFFADLDAQLLAELRSNQERENTVAEFSRITGVTDENVLKSVIKLGVSAESIAALRVFPLVAVAWADGMLEDSERETVMDLASNHIGKTDSPSYKLLRNWLETKPSSEVMSAWTTYAKGIVAAMSEPDAVAFKDSLLGEINAVASANGGILGWGSISKGEHAVMNEITAALTRS
jgi:hypothetical protein